MLAIRAYYRQEGHEAGSIAYAYHGGVFIYFHSLTECSSDLLSAIRANLPEKREDLICRVILTGEGESPDLAALDRALSPEFYGLTLIDRTRLPQNLWARREEDALTGLFLRTMWEKCREEPDNPLWQLAARYGLAALEGGEEA